MFFDMQKYVLYSESLFNALCIEVKYKCYKKNFFGQNKRYKKCTLFSFAGSTHHSFTSNLRFLYELKH